MPRILVRTDVSGWAFWRRAMGLQKYAPAGYTVVVADNDQYHYDPKVLGRYAAVLLMDMTSSHPGGRAVETARLVRFVGSHAWLYPGYDPDDWRSKGANGRNGSRAREIVQDCDAVFVHSKEQCDFFRAIHGDVRRMPYPVDCDLFEPGPAKPEGRKLTVGWCGQLGGGHANFKGFVEIMVPLIAELGNCFNWRINHADFRDALDGRALVEWYQGCDVFLTTSSGEGGPQPPFEAAACGCVVLSTEVGQVADWSALTAAGLTTPAYRNRREADAAVAWFAQKLRLLDQDRALVDALRAKLVRSVREAYNAAREVPKHLAMIAGRP